MVENKNFSQILRKQQQKVSSEHQTEPKVSIYLSYHKNSTRLKSEIFHPIHVGRAVARKEVIQQLKDIIGDNTGDNISEKNSSFCELTAQYWAWKNDGDSDYLGFMHYRRHLNFNLNNQGIPNEYGVINNVMINNNYRYIFGLTDSNIKNVVTQYDVITVAPWNVTNVGSKNNYDHYKNSDSKLFIKDYDKAIEILLSKYPTYKKAVDEYNKSILGYYTNTFVMTRKIFNDYSSFLFSILFELEEQIDISQYSYQEGRVFGYISEWLFGIYLTNLKLTNGSEVKLLELNRTFVEKDSKMEENDIHICTASDDRYAAYLGVMITSLLANKKKNEVIYVYVLDSGISDLNKEKFKQFSEYGTKFFIYFLHVDNTKLQGLECTLKNTHIKLASYNRLLMPSLLPDYLDKVIYLDADIVVQQSLSSLYEVDMRDALIYGVKDVLVKSNTERLKLDKYVNAGVLLINLKEWRTGKIEEKFFEYIQRHRDKIIYHDQDVINVTLQAKLRYLEAKWNAQTSSYPGSEEQNEIAKQACIIHFVSDRKPWIVGTDTPYAYLYEKYQKISPWADISFIRQKSRKIISIRSFRYYSNCVRLANIIAPVGTKRRSLIKKLFMID